MPVIDDQTPASTIIIRKAALHAHGLMMETILGVWGDVDQLAEDTWLLAVMPHYLDLSYTRPLEKLGLRYGRDFVRTNLTIDAPNFDHWKRTEMLAAPELTASESELLQQLLDEVDARRRGRVKTTLPFLLEIWNHWALLTARGYQLTLDEYVNGLFIREHIEQIIEHGPATVTEKIAPMIKQADGIFLAVTQAARRSLAPRYSRAGSVDWWWWRLPLRYSAEFERNLRRADLIDETTQ